MAKGLPGVRVIDPMTVGSGVRLRELITVPAWLLFTGRTMMWFVRHYVQTGLLVAWGFMWWVSGSVLWGLLLVVVLLGLMVTGMSIVRARSCSYASLREAFLSIYRQWYLQRKWHHACLNAGILDRLNHKAPRLRKVRATSGSATANVKLSGVGRTSDELKKQAETIASVLRAFGVDVEPVTPGLARIAISWGDTTALPVRLKDLQNVPAGAVPFGRTQDYKTAYVTWYTSVLAIGEAGSGKSTFAWAYAAGLLRQQVPFRAYVIDPAGGVEMAAMEDAVWCKYYCAKVSEVTKLVKQFRDAMHARLHAMKQRGVRTHTPTEAEPLMVLFIDELLLLAMMLHEGAESPLGEVLTIGRKARYIVVGLSQLSQVDALGRARDLFPQRICFATRSREMTEAALGPSAETSGAACTRIPKTTPGVAYLWVETDSRAYTRVRSAFVDDDEIQSIVRGVFPVAAGEEQKKRKVDNCNRRCAVYHFYDMTGAPIYYGKAFNPAQREKEHRKESEWYRHVDHTRTIIHWYGNEEEALKNESIDIARDRPRYNIVGQPLNGAGGTDAA